MKIDEKLSIIEVERRRRIAVVELDLCTLDELFAEDLLHVHSTGLVHNKTELLEHINRKRGFIAVDRGPLEVWIAGNIAVMTGPIINKMRAKDGCGQLVMNGFVTQILRHDRTGWRFTNFQLTVSAEY